MGLSKRLEEAVSQGGSTPKETVSTIDWNLRNIGIIGSVTLDAITKLKKGIMAGTATAKEVDDVIEDLEFDIQKRIIRRPNKGRVLIDFLKNIKKDLK